MTYSMTGFSRVQQQIGTCQLCWEVRSVNHRYLDCSFKLPESLRYLEPTLRTVAVSSVFRGKIECQLKLITTSDDNHTMLINRGLARALVDLSDEMATTYHLANDFGVSQLLAWPSVVKTDTLDEASLKEPVLSLFTKAMTELKSARASEGTTLRQHIEERLSLLLDEVQKAKILVANLASQTRDKLETKINHLKLEVPEDRLMQEIALILAKLDVTEELDRLYTHCIEVKKVLDFEGSVGRKLDFLMQELNREANTLSSKSDSSALTQCSVEMKVLIEQMREQIQNIE